MNLQWFILATAAIFAAAMLVVAVASVVGAVT